jgi:hypothetical protein
MSAFAFMMAIAFLFVPAAHALNTCGNYFNDLTLSSDVTMPANNTSPCILMQAGKKLNLNGWTIKCASGSPCANQPAVACADYNGGLAVNSVIYGGTIDGNFSIGVDNCGTVRDMKMTGPTTGIRYSSNGKDYYRNVIQLTGTTGTGIDVKLEDSTDTIHDNRIDGGGTGIKVIGKSGSATGPRVYQNVIRGFATYGLRNADSTYVRFEESVMIEGLPGSTGVSIQSGNATLSGLVCEKGSQCSCELDKVQAPGNCFTP